MKIFVKYAKNTFKINQSYVIISVMYRFLDTLV